MSTPIPRPGEHLPGARPTVDPAHVCEEVDALLARVREGASVPGAASADQSVLLEQADLVVSRKQGREKLHYLNPVPIRLIHDRWIDKFTQHHVTALADLKRQLEDKP